MSDLVTHDTVFKVFLTDEQTARDFLAIHLPQPLRELCDLSTLRLEPGNASSLRRYVILGWCGRPTGIHLCRHRTPVHGRSLNGIPVDALLFIGHAQPSEKRSSKLATGYSFTVLSRYDQSLSLQHQL